MSDGWRRKKVWRSREVYVGPGCGCCIGKQERGRDVSEFGKQSPVGRYVVAVPSARFSRNDDTACRSQTALAARTIYFIVDPYAHRLPHILADYGFLLLSTETIPGTDTSLVG